MEFLFCVKHSWLLPEHGLQSSRGEHDRLAVGRLGNHLKRDNDIAGQVWSFTSRELKHAQNQALLLIQSAQERVAGFLLEMADRAPAGDEVELPMPRQDIADYLGQKRAAIALPTSRPVVLRSRSALNRKNADSVTSGNAKDQTASAHA
jgi:hypothetical protein